MRKLVLGSTLVILATGLLIGSAQAEGVCVGNGTSGKRVHLIYGYPAGTQNNVILRVPSIRTGTNTVDGVLGAASGGQQGVRWLCNTLTNLVVVDVVEFPAIGADGKFNLFDDVIPRLQSLNYDRTDRVYWVGMDHIQDAFGPGGQASIDHDDRPGADNPNNTGPAYAMVDGNDVGWGAVGRGFIHEGLGHTLGAVQCSAPHSSCPAGELGHHHCYEENDYMCYRDGGSYYDNGGCLQGETGCAPRRCPGAEEFDCGKDDYYNINPPNGSYLDTHWNVARSGFLT